MSTCIRQTAASHPKFAFTPTFLFCNLICLNYCGVVFLWKYISVFEKWFFSFDRSNVQIFTLNVTWVVWPHLTNLLDLRYFCHQQSFVLSSKLNLLSLLKLAKKYLFFGEYFCPTFSMSKSSIKTKTVLTMTDMTESTELLAFKRQKDGYKVTVKISLCICVVLSWDELKVRQNLLASDYEIHMVCLLVATVYWHKSLQFLKKSYIILLPCLFMISSAVSMIKLCYKIIQIVRALWLAIQPFYMSVCKHGFRSYFISYFIKEM